MPYTPELWIEAPARHPTNPKPQICEPQTPDPHLRALILKPTNPKPQTYQLYTPNLRTLSAVMQVRQVTAEAKEEHRLC